MIIKGKYTSAEIFTENIEDAALQWVEAQCDHPAFDSVKIVQMPDAGELVHDLLLVLELHGRGVPARHSPRSPDNARRRAADGPARESESQPKCPPCISPGTALDTKTTFPSIRAAAFPSAPTDSTVTPRTISFSFCS